MTTKTAFEMAAEASRKAAEPYYHVFQDDAELPNNRGYITISGPTACGKSLILARIEQVLRDEFGATTISTDLDQERAMIDLSKADRQLPSTVVWILREQNIARKSS